MKRYMMQWIAVLVVIAVVWTGREASAQLPIRYVDVTRTAGAKTGASWTDAYTNIWDGLRIETVATEFWIAQGTYSPTNWGTAGGLINATTAGYIRGTIIGDQLYGGFVGTESALSQRDWAAHPTILSGDGNNDGISDIIPESGLPNAGDATERPMFHVHTTPGPILDGFTLQYANNVGTHTRHGGALYVVNTDLTIRNCTFRNNTSSRGGAIAIRSGGLATSCRIENTLFYGNVCATNNFSTDGGIYTFQGTGAVGLYLTNCTFMGNSITEPWTAYTPPRFGNSGADVRLHSLMTGGATFKNCIFWSTTNSLSEGIVPGITFSDVRQLTGVHAGTGNINADPGFVNGTGPAYDFRLLTGSPCIEAGDNTGISATKDLDFGTRIIGTIEMGAYEKVASATADLTVNGSPAIGFDVEVFRVGTFNDTTDFTLTGLDQGSMDLTATSPKVISGNERYRFRKWNDGSTDFTANPLTGYSLNGNKTFTLTYDQQFRATNDTMNGTGTSTMDNSSGWTNVGFVIRFDNAVPGSGFVFDHWEDSTGTDLGNGAFVDITIACPTNVGPYFTAIDEQVDIQTDPPGLNFNADGVDYYDSQSFSWADTAGGPPGHVLYGTNQPVSATEQWRVDRWSDNFDTTYDTNYTFFVNGAGPYNTTVYFHQWWKLGTIYNEAQGSVTTSSLPADAFFDDNAVVTLTAVPVGGNFEFSSWSGSISGTLNPTNVTMDSAKTITANFRQIVFVDASKALGGNNGTTWANAYTNIYTALFLSGAGMEYRVAAGTYNPTNWAFSRATLETGDILLGGFPVGGGLPATRDWASNPTYISGDGNDDGVSDITFAATYWTAGGTTPQDFPLLYSVGTGVKIDGFTLQYAQNISTHTRWGGALYINGGDATVRNCVIRRNGAWRGAGIAVSAGVLSAANCLFYANTNYYYGAIDQAPFADSGAAIYTRDNFTAGTAAKGVFLTNCTFALNDAYGSGGDDVKLNTQMLGPSTLKNCIFWSTNATETAAGSNSGVVQTNGYAGNVYMNCDRRGYPFLNGASGNISSDPVFISEAGGNLRLTGSSSCFNTGDDTGVDAMDLDHTARIQGPHVDIGAYEKAITPLANLTVSDSPDGGAFEVVVQRLGTWTRNTDFTLTSLDQGALTMTATSPKTIDATSRYAFDKWNDGTTDYANPLAGYDLNGDKTFTVSFKTQYLVATATSPEGACSGFTMNPADGWADSGGSMQVTATGILLGFSLSDWLLNGVSQGASDNPHTFSGIAGPSTVTAVFTCGGSTIMVGTSPDGRTYTADGDGPRTGDKPYCWGASSTKTLATTANQDVGNTQYRFANWSDGLGWSSGLLSASYTVPGADTTVRANFTTWHKLTVTAPSGGSFGYVPALGDTYYLEDQVVTVTAIPNATYALGSWSGTATAGATINGNDITFTMDGPKTLAATFAPILRVDKDSVAGTPDGLTWPTAYPTLQAALLAAGAGTEIWVADGTYRPGTLTTDRFNMKANVGVYGGFTGISSGGEFARTQRDWNSNVTILSGDLGQNDLPIWVNRADNAVNVVYASGLASTVLDGFTVQGGYSTGGSGNGAGMYGANSAITVANCVFTDNHAGYSGGGISFSQVNPATVENCKFLGNTTVQMGGGMYAIASGTDVAGEIRNCVFIGNRCEGSADSKSDGGGLYLQDAEYSVVNCSVYGNYTGRRGGGVKFGSQFVPLVSFVMKNCILWGNATGTLDAGADLAVQNASTLTLDMSYSDYGGVTKYYNYLASVIFTAVKEEDPLFAGAPGGDLHLTSTSPCKDTGTSSGAPLADIEGRTRPTGAGVDMGAYEYELTYTLTYSAGAGGSIVGTTPQTVAAGGSGTLVTATPDPGYHFLAWSDAHPTATRTDLNVSGNVNVTATFEANPPLTVTINQAVGQADPTTGVTINFTVVFSQAVSDFATGDVTLGGTAGATTAIVTGSGTTYNVAVSGMSAGGTVIASIDAGRAHDDAYGTANNASTSTDNEVTFTLSAVLPDETVIKFK
ncbi:MAG: hypothetical protein K8T26_17680 [Lentisphaerae bacterium]|nr:hypothetical protein [Lentisphaerota bacterium]